MIEINGAAEARVLYASLKAVIIHLHRPLLFLDLAYLNSWSARGHRNIVIEFACPYSAIMRSGAAAPTLFYDSRRLRDISNRVKQIYEISVKVGPCSES